MQVRITMPPPLQAAGEADSVRRDRFLALQFDSLWDTGGGGGPDATGTNHGGGRRNEIWLFTARRTCYFIFCTVHY